MSCEPKAAGAQSIFAEFNRSFSLDQDYFQSGVFADLESMFFAMCAGLFASIVVVVKLGHVEGWATEPVPIPQAHQRRTDNGGLHCLIHRLGHNRLVGEQSLEEPKEPTAQQGKLPSGVLAGHQEQYCAPKERKK